MANLKYAAPEEAGEVEDESAEEAQFTSRGIEAYKDWVRDAEDAHTEARKLSHRDRDWYDNFDDTQWDEKEKQILQRRGQPIVTMNRIKRKINFLCGIEQKSRTDPKAYARKPQNADQAQVATDVLDYIENTIRFDKVASQAFKCLSIDGISAVDVCYEKGKGAYGITPKEIDFDQFFYDPRSRQPDFADARFIGYHNWYDEEDALEMFDTEEAESAIKGSNNSETSTDQGYDDKPTFSWSSGSGKRQRVRIACMYWKNGEGVWCYTYFCGGGIIEEGVSKYLNAEKEPDCPIIAASAYVTRENERYGAVRDMISPQSEMNYRRSMALFLMKNRRVWSQQGVFGKDQNVKEEVARADAHLIANGQYGTEWGFIESASEIGQNFELLQDAKAEIDAQGPNAGLQGRGVENQSGIAIQAQQNAGLAEENTLFDTHNDWKLRVYRAFWARAKQFWKEEIWLRIADADEEGGARFTPLNQPAQPQMPGMGGPQPMQPQGMPQPGMGMPGQPPQGMPQMPPQQPQGDPMAMMAMMGGGGQMQPPQPSIMNSLAEMDVDIIIEAAPDMLSLQHEEYAKLTEMVKAGLPVPPDVILEASQIRDKKKLVQRMKEDGGLQAKLQQAAKQIEEMTRVIEQMQQAMQQKPQEPTSALDQARIQEMMQKAMREDRKLQLEEAKAGPQMAKDRAQATATMITATKPNPAPRPANT
jgi:hypothetical protein